MSALRNLAIAACMAGALTRCISGDDSATSDGGSDAASDVTNDTTLGDGAVDAGPPSPDGSLAWFQHFNTNHGFEDLAVNENGGPSYVLAGGFTTDPDAGDMLQMGSHQLGPTGQILTSSFLSTLTSQGPGRPRSSPRSATRARRCGITSIRSMPT